MDTKYSIKNKFLEINVVLDQTKLERLQLKYFQQKEDKIEIIGLINQQFENHQGKNIFIQEFGKENPYFLGKIPSNSEFIITLSELDENPRKYQIYIQSSFVIVQYQIKNPKKATAGRNKGRTVEEIDEILYCIENTKEKQKNYSKTESLKKACQLFSEKQSTVRQYQREMDFAKSFNYDIKLHSSHLVGNLYKYNFIIKEGINNWISSKQLNINLVSELLTQLKKDLKDSHPKCCLNSVNQSISDKHFLAVANKLIQKYNKKQNNRKKIQLTDQNTMNSQDSQMKEPYIAPQIISYTNPSVSLAQSQFQGNVFNLENIFKKESQQFELDQNYQNWQNDTERQQYEFFDIIKDREIEQTYESQLQQSDQFQEETYTNFSNSYVEEDNIFSGNQTVNYEFIDKHE